METEVKEAQGKNCQRRKPGHYRSSRLAAGDHGNPVQLVFLCRFRPYRDVTYPVSAEYPDHTRTLFLKG